IVFRDLALSEPDQAQPALTAERVTARVALLPLLRRQVIFYEIRVLRPTAHLVRDAAGHVALLDKLLNLPFLKQQSNEFSLDVRALKVDGGDIELTDQASMDGVTKWRLIETSLELERVRGQRLRDFMQKLLKRQPSVTGMAAEFYLNGTV